LNKYGVESSKIYGHIGFDAFGKIYNISFSQVKADISTQAKQDYPSAPSIN
jgi:hypothetical protein